MRSLNHRIYWFQSISNGAIVWPPLLPWPVDKGLQYYDLFLHRDTRSETIQAWRYVPNGNQDNGKWAQLEIGSDIEVPGLPGPRTFVINGQGKPSFVLKGTVAKLYSEFDK